MRRGKKRKYVRTTVSLPEDLWKKLKIESIEEKTPLGELIAKKLKELEELKTRKSFSSP
ncbi:chromosome segregation protein SMC [Hydrogenivirga sp.]